ncbi:MAG: iron ABC transporter permease [Gammaproteobacteria bacterium]|nr:iron ABC transporter permease [Gammaproteobacteria bacterium]
MPRAGLGILALILLIAAVVSLGVGTASIPMVEVFSTLMGEGFSSAHKTIVVDIRLPRTLLAVLVGAGVATSGAAIQGLFRNPLADPALIGVSGGAALFAAGYLVVGVELGIASLGIAVSAFVGGLLTTWLVLEIGRRGGTISSMLLAGVAINAVALSGVGILTYLSSDIELRSVAFWALGSLNGADWTAVIIAGSILPIIAVFLTRSEQLNAITLGDREAGHLGISVARLRIEIVILTALATGISVALCGVIAFVGLVVPHLIRLSLGSNHYVVIPGSAILGGILLLFADSLSRTVFSPAELPVGIITALLGGPFFIYLIVRQKGKLGL